MTVYQNFSPYASESVLPKVTILVVNYNGKKHLEEFIKSVIKLNYPNNKYNLVIVDNGSTDDSVDYIKKRFRNYVKGIYQPLIKIVALKNNYGFALGNNIGVKYCDGEYLALINNDTVIDPNWLYNLIKHAIKKPNSLYGSLMLHYDFKNTIIYSGGKMLYWGYPLSLNTYNKNQKGMFKDKPILTFYADGCGLLLKKGLFIKLHGFNPSYFAYAEDYELSWKAWMHGYSVYFVPTSFFWHKISSTLGSRSSLYLYLLWRNQFRNIIIFCDGTFCLTMPVLFVLFGIFSGIFLFGLMERNFTVLPQIIMGILDSIKKLPSLLQYRKKLHKNKKISCKELNNKELILDFQSSIYEAIRFFKRMRMRNIT
jgi:GT2 family glycosyltransferase